MHGLCQVLLSSKQYSSHEKYNRFLLGLFTTVIALLIMASIVERGESNAISLYLAVFFMPVLLLAALNAIYIQMLSRIKNHTYKSIFWLLPSLVLSVLTLLGPLVAKALDADLAFATLAGAISFGLTNLLWVIKLRSKPINHKL